MVNNKKRNITVLIVIVFACFLSFVIFKIASVEYHLLYTEDIKDYGSEKYSIPLTVFPAVIPSNAQVVSFSYYDYWHEAEDIYLELKFNSAEELEHYLSALKSECITICQKNNASKNQRCFAEEKNIYDESFVDLFCLVYYSSEQNNLFTGYVIENEKETIRYKCNFGLISYSYDELTVIHSYVRGWYRDEIHNYIPKYFVRFNVPLNRDHERLIYLES